MPTVLNERGFRFMIYTEDHPPAHVHVLRSGATVIIEFDGPLTIRRSNGMRTRDIAIAKTLVEDNLDYLRDEWRRIHG